MYRFSRQLFGAILCIGCPAVHAEEGELWSATLYAGPATNNYASQIFHGSFHINGPMVGLAVDRHLANLGAGFSLVAEAELTHYFLSPPTTTVGLGLGIKYELFTIAPGAPVAIAFYMGPSYSADSPFSVVNGGAPQRHPFLNYLSSEMTVGIPNCPGWDVSFRSFHRSGMYGLYARGVDEGSMLGFGIRYRF